MYVNPKRNILIVAGEASADRYGAKLVKEIKRLAPELDFIGIGGDMMKAEGVKIIYHASQMAVVGITEVFSHSINILKAYMGLKKIINEMDISLIILLDYPEFNLSIAGIGRKNKIPVLYYISPQIWAWRRGRVRKIAKRVNRMAVILPFEEEFYRTHGISVEYVGHPLVEEIQHEDPLELPQPKRKAHPVLGILPGSRAHEVKNLLPPMLRAVEIIGEKYSDLEVVLPIAPTISPHMINSMISGFKYPIRVFERTREALINCDSAIIASGTATLEAALFEVPMVVAYKVSQISFYLAKLLVKVPYISLVNLIANHEVVPELIQQRAEPLEMANHILRILENKNYRNKIIRGLKEVKNRLGGGNPSRRTAEIAIELIQESQS